jgi:hypothetical protein
MHSVAISASPVAQNDLALNDNCRLPEYYWAGQGTGFFWLSLGFWNGENYKHLAIIASEVGKE